MGNDMPTFADSREFRHLLQRLPAPDARAEAQARERNAALTKPNGSLGRLEETAIWYASWRGHARPEKLAPQILIFAGSHGVARQGVSAFPSEVTGQMVANFNEGGAAINQLAGIADARLDVQAIDLDRPTADISEGPAMSEHGFVSALAAGWRAVCPQAGLLIAGEMGIGNTTAASAICLALFGGDASDWVGRGTGVTGGALRRKTEIVRNAVDKNRRFASKSGLNALQSLGGRETAAIAGAIARARCLRIPVLLDGFVCCAAAAAIQAEARDALDHALAGHRSAEAAHGRLLAQLAKPPLLDLGMRLGEGSGAAVAVQLLRCALACHSGMATFSEAGVSGK